MVTSRRCAFTVLVRLTALLAYDFLNTRSSGLTDWPTNRLRHSFCSYRLAATNNAHLVASELGHTTSQLVHQHYRELVTPEEAKRYWQIEPAAQTEKIVAFSAS
jgi:integrase